MAVLDQVKQMQQQGITDTQIMQNLQEQGVSPREISEALSQSQVKAAIEQPPENQPMPGTPQPPQELQNSTQQAADLQGMQPSIMQDPQQTITPGTPQSTAEAPQSPMPQIQEQSAQQYQPPMQEPSAQQYSQQPIPDQQQYSDQQYQDPYAQQGYDPYAGYDQQGYDPNYYQQGGIDLQTIKDISKQIIEQETEKLNDKINNLEKTKTEMNFQLQEIDNRLKKIEATIEQLQSAILQKIGDYGRAVQDVSNELKATQKSFSKLTNPLMDSQRNKGFNPKKNKQKQQSNKPKPSIRNQESSTGFEDYFR